MNDSLRRDVKLMKALQGISYAEIAEYLEIKQRSFYAWLHGQYELSFEKQQRLREILDNLSE